MAGTNLARGAKRGIIGRPLSGYVPELDGMRAFAVAAVMLSHIGFPWAHGGKGGVLLFFVLSGYLITTVLVRELKKTNQISFKAFYARRALRLAPALLLVTLVTAAYAFLTRASDMSQATLQSVPSVLLYVINWQQVLFGSASAGYFNHFWTLAVEEQFYIVWPIILIAVYKWRGLAAAGWVAVGGAALTIVVKVIFWNGSIGRQAGTDFAADALLLGCGLAIFLASDSSVLDRVFRFGYWLGVAGITSAVVFGRSGGASDPIGYEVFGKVWWPVAVISAAVIIGATVRGVSPLWAGAVLRWTPLVYLGRISYGMYLWHMLVIGAVPADDWPLMIVLVFPGTIALAALSFHFVEKPFLRLKSRFERTTESTVAAAGARGVRPGA
jgi:peptidoglycan/LPS O-acetylase OafA/YrhL